MPTAIAKHNKKTESLVLEYPTADPKIARAHFAARLAVETDCWDVHADLSKKEPGILVIDTRSPESYAQGHIPGAVNFWHQRMNAETTARLPKGKILVTYCSGIGCNGSTKGAFKLAGLGFRVKEMLGGLEFWKNEGYSIETGPGKSF